MVSTKVRLPAEWLSGQVRVLVIGAGGTGSQVVNGLAQLDRAIRALGHPGGLSVTVVDDDLVSEANVGRQNFFPSDVGLPKADVLIQRVNMAMGTNWRSAVLRIQPQTDLKNPHLVIGCVDNRKARAAILAATSRYCHGAPDKDGHYANGWWLDIGNRLSDGQVILGETRNQSYTRIPNAADLFPSIVDETAEDPDEGPSCSLAEALEKQSLFVNRGVALFALNMLWEWFRYGELSYHGVFVNMKTSRTSTLAIDQEAWKRFGYVPPKPPRQYKKAA